MCVRVCVCVSCVSCVCVVCVSCVSCVVCVSSVLSSSVSVVVVIEFDSPVDSFTSTYVSLSPACTLCAQMSPP